MDWDDKRRPTPPLLDMMPDGRFARPSPLASQVLRIALLVAVIAAAAAAAALALWIALALIPIAAVAAVVAYAAYRWQVWRARRGSFRGERDPFGL
jgi:hypothetical protein